MSHVATNWAFSLKDLRPAEKLLLLVLADRHNPDRGCFPSQDRLADEACISRASVNDNLARLEERGLIRRQQQICERTKRQQNTRYILGFEPEFAQEPCPETGHGETGTAGEHGAAPCPENGHGPCPDSGQSRVQILDTNLVREPEEEEERAETRNPSSDFSNLVGRIAQALNAPEIVQTPWWRAEANHGTWITPWRELGLIDDAIVAVAKRFGAEKPTPPQGPKALDLAMQRAAKSRHPTGERSHAPLEDRVRFWAGMLRDNRYIAPSALTQQVRRALVAKGHATEEDLRRKGL